MLLQPERSGRTREGLVCWVRGWRSGLEVWRSSRVRRDDEQRVRAEHIADDERAQVVAALVILLRPAEGDARQLRAVTTLDAAQAPGPPSRTVLWPTRSWTALPAPGP